MFIERSFGIIASMFTDFYFYEKSNKVTIFVFILVSETLFMILANRTDENSPSSYVKRSGIQIKQFKIAHDFSELPALSINLREFSFMFLFALQIGR